MATVTGFIQSPSDELLNSCTKEQLLKLIEHYDIDIGEKRLKEEIKGSLRAALIENGVLQSPSGNVAFVGSTAVALTFEQQKELLLLQMERDKLGIEKERLRRSLEKEKLELQQYRLDLIKAGGLSGDAGTGWLEESVAAGSQSLKRFDVVGNLRLVPKCEERDPDTFFSLFERVANVRGWPEADRVVLLQSVLTGKAQEAYSALGEIESKNFATVKEAILKAYELVPEAYRQHFRSWRKSDKQSHVEFAKDLTKHFNRWCSALEVTTFKDLCDLMIQEQFKESIPPEVATHIAERGVKTASEAATLADEYALAHKRNFGKCVSNNSTAKAVQSAKSTWSESAKTNYAPRSVGVGQERNYCHERGHWKAEYPVLKNRVNHSGWKKVKPAALSAPVRKFSVVSEEQRDSVKPETEKYSGFEAFVSDGFVSLTGSDNKVAVKILRYRRKGFIYSGFCAALFPGIRYW
uniref:SCAN box domain-containing protein n=1 Tax=Sparus aurata TaxID=8175 RepID=A0A671UNG2_SPAAU